MRRLTRRSQGHVLRRRGDLDRHAEVAQCVEAGGQAFEHSFDAARARFPRGLVALVNDTLYAVGDEDIFQFDVTSGGWIHLILGVVVAVAGVTLLQAATWARVVAADCRRFP